MAKVQASAVMMRILEDWGVKRLYGLPGGSFDSTMNAIRTFRDRITYVGVRHEEVGALAAVAEAKLTGRIGVTFGSAGPGAVHLLNGLYDAKTDHVPVLALIGQVPTSRMNTDFFQEMPENPMFADVAVYNRTVMTAEQLPQIVDTAIRTAYEKRGVAVVVIPKDLGWAEIDDDYKSSAEAYTQGEWNRPADPADVERVLDLMSSAKRPMIYFGQGAAGSADLLREAAELFHTPLGATYLAKGILEGDEPYYMMSTGRVATKPGVDIARSADFVLFIGTNFEFPMFSPEATFVDVNIRPSVLGSRHETKLGILADASIFMKQLIDAAKARGYQASEQQTRWFEAAQADRREWDAWVAKKATETDRVPVRFEPIYKLINEVADDNAVFGVDVGNTNIAVARFLDLNKDKRQVTSPLYATMGFGIPAGIAAAMEYPDREVWTLSGDGGAAMVVPDIITQAEHHLPVINIVFTNKSLGFIEAEQDDTHQPHSGVALQDVAFAKVAEGFGVKGYTVETFAQFEEAIREAKTSSQPVLIDVKLTNDRLLPVEQYPVDRASKSNFDEFVREYEAEDLTPFSEILAEQQA
ncbi:MAG: pyruvate oxidase [Actinomycetaceae bacterium]|nr:pyruvate oxidase [Arcanobacterium sp.]MDD7504344.1 pyruvate oxidase [Actinomycetaceae bacterium]